MREIIFRAWDGKNYSIGKPEYFDDSVNFRFHHFDIDCEKPVLEQYTGLNPSLVKNEKLVFDGDIVKITDHTIEETFESCGSLVTMLMTRTYEVFWNTTKWSIKLIEPMLGVDPPIFDLPTKNVTYEIVGNIHDQKEDV